jgi:hypothetical protein
MDLHTYMLSLREAERSTFAQACGTTVNYLWNLSRKSRKAAKRQFPAPKLASLIETHSNKSVCRWESNPDDWFITWPELISTEGAPAVPANDARASLSEAA